MAPDRDLSTLASDFWARATVIASDLSPAESRRLVLGLLHLRRLWDAFERRRKQLAAETHDVRSVHFTVSEADRARMLERPELYRSAKVAWVTRAARWPTLRAYAGQPNLGRLIDAALLTLEQENPPLAGVIGRNYGNVRVRPSALLEMMGLIERVTSSVSGASVAAGLEALIQSCPDFPQSGLGKTPEARMRTLRSLSSQAPYGQLLDRLDDQLRELDRLIDQSRRPRTGSGDDKDRG